ncbi:MAG: type II toxin-antitoxin system PemK/MazF family toxin [Deltaproteobacteria bacterium]|nr:MAG: type II toxin-antitoxin system PemK/MazF family toxin [Deltaproteobacteria bacterium]
MRSSCTSRSSTAAKWTSRSRRRSDISPRTCWRTSRRGLESRHGPRSESRRDLDVHVRRTRQASAGAPTEVELGVEDGLKTVSCANLANIQTVAKRNLTRYVGTARREKLAELCRALAIASGCD